MCRKSHRHDPIACVLPPGILDKIAENGNKAQRKAAVRTRALTTEMRIARLTGITSNLPGAFGESTEDYSMARGPNRRILDARHREVDRGAVVRREGDADTGDAAVDEAYQGLGDTYNFFFKLFGRRGIEGRNKALIGVVHYGRHYDNAFWDGDSMQFGDGDGSLFNRFTVAEDVIGHELSHGVTQTTLGLPYYCSGRPLGANPGALNESVSDSFGAVIRQIRLGLGPMDDDGWLIGKGLLAAGVSGRALRDMLAPGTAYDDRVLGKDPQPDHIGKYVVTRGDSGGVHTNSGIPNVAFARSARNLDQAGVKPQDPDAVAGNGSVMAATVLYRVLQGGAPLAEKDVPQDCSFPQWASASIRVAERLYGADGAKAVSEAWMSVGLGIPQALEA